MATLKCKMCGGVLEVSDGTTVATCEYCGTQQTLPKLNDDRRAQMYDRASHFRRNNEFDKAMGIYEQILNEDVTDAEAYWSLVLCRYGVEYVEDPATHKRVPTVSRTQFTSIFDDEDYKSALENADTLQKTIYEAEAKAINEIQKKILSISQKEEPYDVFICYKETDESGRRTRDSVLATELYHELNKEGFNVFFSRITLEDKLGIDYEPYIFAALNSAKVMVVIGTNKDYFNAVWVKNEWSRYLALIKSGDKKRTLIPAYRGMDPYDLPEEFSHLQAQDMNKLGFMPDLIRGIKKLLEKDQPQTVNQSMAVSGETGGESETEPLPVEPINTVNKSGRIWKWTAIALFSVVCLFALIYIGLKIQSASDLEQAVVGTWKITEVANRNGKRIENMTDSGMMLFDADHSLTIELDDLVSGEWSVVDGDTLELRFPDGVTQWTVKKEDADSLHLTLENGDFGEMNEMTFARLAEDAVNTDNAITTQNTRISGGDNYTVFLYDDSTVGAVGDNSLGQCNVSGWTDMISVSAGGFHTVGLKSDGTVIATGQNEYDQCNVSDWTDMIAVSAGRLHTVGLRSDRTVVATGQNDYGECNVSGWTDMIAVSAGFSQTVGLCKDGTVVATGWNEHGQCNVSDWTDMIAVSAGFCHTVGLRSDGTVVATGQNDYGECNVSSWTDIVAVSAGVFYTIGLRRNGTVVATGYNDAGQCDVSDWTDIVEVSAGLSHTVGLRSDGTVVAVGDNFSGQCNLYGGADSTPESVPQSQPSPSVPTSEETLQNFVSSGEYRGYVSEWETAPIRYAILDIGYDGVSDLILSTEESYGFSNFILFTVDSASNSVIPVDQEGFGYQGYCYGGLRYSWESGALTFEHMNADGTGYHEFGQINLYIVEGSQLVWQKGLCYDTAQGTGQRIYSLESADGTSQSLSEEEYNNLLGEIQPVEYETIS